MKVCPSCGRQYPDDANFCPADATRLQADAGETQRGHALAGETALAVEVKVSALLGGRFDLMGPEIGGGLTGRVFAAHDRDSGGQCAVKLVHPAVFPNPLLLQRAERELKHLERIDLPEVARVLGHGRHGEQLWIAMELVSAVELGRLLPATGPLDPLDACQLVRRVANGLAEAAKQGVIHRDLAAKNMLVGEGNSVKIINFPIPVPYSDRVQGVPEFLSPEQVEGKPADQRSSIYSLGALLYYAVTGRPPFEGEPAAVHRAHLQQEPVRPSYVAPVPEVVEAVILKALEKTSSRRFMTLHQMIGELDSILPAPVAAEAAVAARGKVKAPLGPGHTLVGVSSYEQQPMPPAASPVGGATAHGAAPASVPVVRPGGPAAPSMLDPDLASAPTAGSNAASARAGGGSGRGPGRRPASGPLAVEPRPQPARPAAVIVPTPQPAPAGHLSPATANPKKGKSKAGTGPMTTTQGKFRETMWFKKGELDEAAARAAASARTGELVSDKADALPIEDRYRDDGTLDRQDAERFSLRTGATGAMEVQRAEPLARRGVSERFLVSELRRTRVWLLIVLVVLAGALGSGIYYFTR